MNLSRWIEYKRTMSERKRVQQKRIHNAPRYWPEATRIYGMDIMFAPHGQFINQVRNDSAAASEAWVLSVYRRDTWNWIHRYCPMAYGAPRVLKDRGKHGKWSIAFIRSDTFANDPCLTDAQIDYLRATLPSLGYKG